MAESRQQRRARERAEAKNAQRTGPSPARLQAERMVRRTLGDHAHAHSPDGTGWSWCPAVYLQHRDGSEECALGDECLVGGASEPHDQGGDCPGPNEGCEHCASTLVRCDEPLTNHVGDVYLCAAGHNEDDDRDAGRWHPADVPLIECRDDDCSYECGSYVDR